jgi:hypothetical protein
MLITITYFSNHQYIFLFYLILENVMEFHVNLGFYTFGHSGPYNIAYDL